MFLDANNHSLRDKGKGNRYYFGTDNKRTDNMHLTYNAENTLIFFFRFYSINVLEWYERLRATCSVWLNTPTNKHVVSS